MIKEDKKKWKTYIYHSIAEVLVIIKMATAYFITNQLVTTNNPSLKQIPLC